MTEQLTTFVEMMAHLDLDAYMPLPEPHRQTFRKLKELRAQAAAKDNQSLISELQPETQPNELIRVYAASMIVADQVDLVQLGVLGRYLQADKSNSVCIALAKKLRDVPPSDAVPLSQIVSWLLQAIIHGRHAELRVVAAESARETGPASKDAWQEKVETLFKQLEDTSHFREHLDIAALVTAVTPLPELLHSPADRLLLADALIRKAPDYHREPRLTGILAALIIQSCDQNLQRVIQKINRFVEGNQEANDNLASLRAEINSLLTPVELQTALKESYQTPLNTLQEDVRSKWKMSIISAQAGLYLRLGVSLLASVVGLVLLIAGAINLSDEAAWHVSFLQIGLGLVLLLIFLLHRGPVRDTRQTLVDIGVANTVYATFTQQSLDISYRYTTLSLQNRLTATEVKTSHDLLAETMKNAVHTLRGDKPTTLDELLEQYS